MDIQKNNLNIENHSSQDRVLEDTKIQEMQDEIELLREQVESLKQELSNQYQRADEYAQELAHTNQELEWMNQEITNLMDSNSLPLDEAKKFPNKVVQNKKPRTKSVAELGNTSDSFPVQVNTFERVDISSSSLKFETLKAQSDQIKAQSQKLKADSTQMANLHYKITARSRQIRVNSHEARQRSCTVRNSVAMEQVSPEASQQQNISHRAIAS